MQRCILSAVAAVALAIGFAPAGASAQQAEPRIAFVVGNAGYAARPLQNALNDAGLVGEALRSIGFDVVEGADLGQADYMRSFREFLGKVEAAGPEALAFVYFSGYGLQYDGENFLLAAQARLARESDIPLEGIRLSDLVRPLAEVPGRAKVVVVDAGRPLPFQVAGRRMASGLGAVDSPPGMLIAFATAPGSIVEEGAGPYGPYATAIAEMVRNPGLDLDPIFVRVRARTRQISEGQQTPWHVSALGGNVQFVSGDAQADLAAPPAPLRAASAPRPMRDVGPDEAYAQAIEFDTLPSYVDFVSAYPRHPYAPRVWAIIRARREALAWRRAVQLNTPQAYWTYSRRYPNGLYGADAELRLRRLNASLAPPSAFAPVEFFDVPPPLADEPVGFVERPPPAPRPPSLLIAPPPPLFARLPPPPARGPGGPGGRALPVPVVIPVVPRVVPGRPGVVRPAALPPAAVRPAPVAPAPGAPAAVRPGLPPGAVRPGVAPGGPPGAVRPAAPAVPVRPAAVRPGAPAAPGAGVPPARPAPAARPAPTGPAIGSRPPVAPAPVQRPAGPPQRPPPAAIQRPPPPAAIQRPPPPAAIQRPPPPAAIQRPPPPAAIQRPPPPAAVRPPPPAAVQRPPPAAAPAAARPGAPAKKCQVVNGVQVCR